MRHVSLSAVLMCGALVSACGSSPDSGLSPTPVDTGATIRGTIVGSASTASVVALSGSSGVRVTVLGSDIAATTDSGGEFVLEGVPSGTVVLEFDADGNRARLEISGLLPGQEVRITVSISGSDATLVEPGEEVEVEGRIQSLVPFQVRGQTFEIDENTRFRHEGSEIDFADLQVGDRVEVEGVRQPDGSLLALRVELEDSVDHDDDDDDDEDEDDDDDHDDEEEDDEDDDDDEDEDDDD